MKKKLINGMAIVLAMTLLLGIMPGKVWADTTVTAAIAASEVALGGETKVTVTFSGNKEKIILVDMWLTYDPTVLEIVSGHSEGNGGKVRVLSDSGATSYTLVFKAIKAGTSALALTDQTMVGMETTEARGVTAVSTVTVKGTANQSKVNTLSALTVSPGTLSPAFSKDVVTYSIILDESAERLTITATPEDAKAKVTVKDSKLDPGDNVTTVTVTAENGDQKVYTIFTKVPVKKEEPTTAAAELLIDMNGTPYKVVADLDETLLPEGYEIAEYTYKDAKIHVGKGLANAKIIFGLKDALDEKSKTTFAIYDERTGNFSPLHILAVNGMAYTPVEDEAVLSTVTIPDGFVESAYTLDKVSYKVWVDSRATSAEYFIIYCTNVYGDTGWYQYDMVEGTMQRAFLNGYGLEEETTQEVTEPVTETMTEATTADESELQKKYDNYVKKSQLSITLLALLLFVVVIIMVIFVIRSFKEPRDDDDDDDDNDDNGPITIDPIK